MPRRPGPPGALGARETSGVQVRLGERRRSRRAPRRRSRRGVVLAGGLAAGGAAAVVAAGATILLPFGGDGEETRTPPRSVNGVTSPMATGSAPRAGEPVEVGTADGSRYRLAAVRAGTDDGAEASRRSSPPAGSTFAYVEYTLANPSRQDVLLDFPGDVFVRRALVPEQARERCMRQAGVPENMCTLPIRSEVVRRLSGGALEPGDGGDRYLPPGSSYLVRATVEMPVDKRIRRGDVRLYIWKQLYMGDRTARLVPFPG
ncbi:hypothetical protein [Actinomadura viridis]|uniref:Uncharacterized protein n=1 Tax=Actinomadura viridis TaxID=58110 RepID=A0A931DTS1_9ACTN|nr:hypothetical protein [Actinomadura viridis]MBG6093390.1 hypothetical protein [Actinomadura viridis]